MEVKLACVHAHQSGIMMSDRQTSDTLQKTAPTEKFSLHNISYLEQYLLCNVCSVVAS